MGFDVEFHGAPGIHNWKFWDPWIEDAICKLPIVKTGEGQG
jgi:S-formylglutathione hydrolase FrmB